MSVRIEHGTALPELIRMSIGTDKGVWFADPSFGSDLWLLRNYVYGSENHRQQEENPHR
jgi:hypothetical protein